MKDLEGLLLIGSRLKLWTELGLYSCIQSKVPSNPIQYFFIYFFIIYYLLIYL